MRFVWIFLSLPPARCAWSRPRLLASMCPFSGSAPLERRGERASYGATRGAGGRRRGAATASCWAGAGSSPPCPAPSSRPRQWTIQRRKRGLKWRKSAWRGPTEETSSRCSISKRSSSQLRREKRGDQSAEPYRCPPTLEEEESHGQQSLFTHRLSSEWLF